MEGLCSGFELFASTCFVLLLPELNEYALGIFGNSCRNGEILQGHLTESLEGQEEPSDLTEQLLVRKHLLELLLIEWLGGLCSPGLLQRDLQGILEHGPSIRYNHNANIDGVALLVVLEVILNGLLLYESSHGLDTLDAVLFDLPRLHNSLIHDQESAIDQLEESPFKHICVVILLGREFLVLHGIDREWEVHGERRHCFDE